jgi:hypothetical protein
MNGRGGAIADPDDEDFTTRTLAAVCNGDLVNSSSFGVGDRKRAWLHPAAQKMKNKLEG